MWVLSIVSRPSSSTANPNRITKVLSKQTLGHLPPAALSQENLVNIANYSHLN